MNIIVNGEDREIPYEMDLSALLRFLSMPNERVAVELNKSVVPRKNWETTAVKEKDRLEVVHFVGGG